MAVSVIHRASDIVTDVFDSVEHNSLDTANMVVSTWYTIISRIRSSGENGHMAGQNLCDHTRVVDLKNGNLLIETDHPGWIQLLKLHNRYIITGLQKYCPSLHIRIVSYRLAGSGVRLHGDKSRRPAADRKEVQQEIEKRYKPIEAYDKARGVCETPAKADAPVPEKLKTIFANLKESLSLN